jgi:hypothetical protein
MNRNNASTLQPTGLDGHFGFVYSPKDIPGHLVVKTLKDQWPLIFANIGTRTAATIPIKAKPIGT